MELKSGPHSCFEPLLANGGRGGGPERLFEDEQALHYLAHVLRPRAAYIHSMVEIPTSQQVHGTLISELTQELHAKYDGTVLRDSVSPDPPERGPLGLAHIRLKPGAMPKKARAIVLFGAKREDHVQIERSWEEGRKVEDG